MGRSRRTALLVGAVIATVLTVVIAAALYWRAQSTRFDNMRDTVTSFDAPEGWFGWTRVEQTSRSYSPFCIDVACPSYSERYVTAAPEGDVGAALDAAITAMGAGPVTGPARRCITGERCLYIVDGDGLTIDVVINDPFELERATVPDIPEGFVEVTVNLHAY